ncbi:hypothetical protein F2Q69_00054473 [Brassica cretica]|uniref:Uncharacterized protein n=1 Tax=Brassica cretica TaxID=69181 RepID=A0A8S9N2S3_BRACR|nr:hypothetical protein F2Q69_00054473 [Brassica cretica]
MSTLFFGAGGGELGGSCSISLPLLFVGTLAFWLDFGVSGSSSSSPASSSSRFFGCVVLVRAILFFQGCDLLLVGGGIKGPVPVSLGIAKSTLWGSILTGPQRSCLRACSVGLSNPLDGRFSSRMEFDSLG